MPYQKTDGIFSKAQLALTAKLPFVLFRLPDQTELFGLFQPDASIQELHDFDTTGFVFAPFHPTKKKIVINGRLEVDTFSAPCDPLPLRNEVIMEGKKSHIALVKKAIVELRKGELKKVVLSRTLDLPFRNEPVAFFKRLLSCYRNAFCYLWYHPKIGMWSGATPERLVGFHKGRLQTSSLAGTLPFHQGKDPNWSQKEIEEQQMVTDYISGALEGLVDNLTFSELKTVRSGALWHLKTEIEGLISQEDLALVIDRLHPTPAVCGLPKQKALEFITDNESYDRTFYTGYLGTLNLISPGRTDLFVNLRCARIDNGRVNVYVGGGITSDSDAVAEWQETVHKSKTMIDVM